MQNLKRVVSSLCSFLLKKGKTSDNEFSTYNSWANQSGSMVNDTETLKILLRIIKGFDKVDKDLLKMSIEFDNNSS